MPGDILHSVQDVIDSINKTEALKPADTVNAGVDYAKKGAAGLRGPYYFMPGVDGASINNATIFITPPTSFPVTLTGRAAPLDKSGFAEKRATIASLSGNGTNSDYVAMWINAEGKLAGRIADGTGSFDLIPTSNLTFDDGIEHVFVAAIRATEIDLWADGEFIETFSHAKDPFSGGLLNQFSLGGTLRAGGVSSFGGFYGQHWGGQLYSVELSAAELSELSANRSSVSYKYYGASLDNFILNPTMDVNINNISAIFTPAVGSLAHNVATPITGAGSLTVNVTAAAAGRPVIAWDTDGFIGVRKGKAVRVRFTSRPDKEWSFGVGTNLSIGGVSISDVDIAAAGGVSVFPAGLETKFDAVFILESDTTSEALQVFQNSSGLAPLSTVFDDVILELVGCVADFSDLGKFQAHDAAHPELIGEKTNATLADASLDHQERPTALNKTGDFTLELAAKYLMGSIVGEAAAANPTDLVLNVGTGAGLSDVASLTIPAGSSAFTVPTKRLFDADQILYFSSPDWVGKTLNRVRATAQGGVT